eukprot:840939-Rhodomonas_salina.2
MAWSTVESRRVFRCVAKFSMLKFCTKVAEDQHQPTQVRLGSKPREDCARTCTLQLMRTGIAQTKCFSSSLLAGSIFGPTTLSGVPVTCNTTRAVSKQARSQLIFSLARLPHRQMHPTSSSGWVTATTTHMVDVATAGVMLCDMTTTGMTSLPWGAGGDHTSRNERGGIRISSSSGNCERKLSAAPLSIAPTCPESSEGFSVRVRMQARWCARCARVVETYPRDAGVAVEQSAAANGPSGKGTEEASKSRSKLQNQDLDCKDEGHVVFARVAVVNGHLPHPPHSHRHARTHMQSHTNTRTSRHL